MINIEFIGGPLDGMVRAYSRPPPRAVTLEITVNGRWYHYTIDWTTDPPVRVRYKGPQ